MDIQEIYNRFIGSDDVIMKRSNRDDADGILVYIMWLAIKEEVKKQK